MLASVAKFPSRCASISVSVMYLPPELPDDEVPQTSKPLSDNESPPACIVFLKNDALCQRRLLSGFGDGGSRSEKKYVKTFESNHAT